MLLRPNKLFIYRFLYVAAAFDKKIHVYHIEADFNLTLSQVRNLKVKKN